MDSDDHNAYANTLPIKLLERLLQFDNCFCFHSKGASGSIVLKQEVVWFLISFSFLSSRSSRFLTLFSSKDYLRWQASVPSLSPSPIILTLTICTETARSIALLKPISYRETRLVRTLWKDITIYFENCDHFLPNSGTSNRDTCRAVFGVCSDVPEFSQTFLDTIG